MKPTSIRKVLAGFLAVLLLAALFPVTGGAYAAGDVDGDGAVRAGDARLCLRRAVGLESYPAGSAAYTACDLDGDGQITAGDARLILRAAVGLNIDDGLSGRTVIAVPVTVYEGKRGAVTLTEYKTVASGPLAEGSYLVCVLKVTDTSGMRYTLSAEAVTVNGRRLPDTDASAELPPNGSANLRLVIPEPYLDLSGEGDPPADEILARIPFYSPAEKRTYYAKIALYPTGKTPGTAVYPASAPQSVSQETEDFLFGFNSAESKTATDPDGSVRVGDVDAVFYFRNKSDRDLVVEFTDVTLNDGVLKYNHPQKLFVFAGTVAEPEIHITPSFFSANKLNELNTLNYTIAVRDAKTDALLYQKAYRIRGIKTGA